MRRSIFTGRIASVSYTHLDVYKRQIVYNPFFDVTNSIGSLWMAKSLFCEDEDTIVANGDVFWSQDILDIVKNIDQEVFLLADSDRCLLYTS